MKTWWDQRAPREQLLLLAAGVLLALAVFVQAVLVPSVNRRNLAAGALAESERTLVRIDRLGERGVTQISPPAPASPQDVSARAAEWAAQQGLIADPQLTSASELRFAFKGAAPDAVFRWIEQVETGLGAAVRTAQLTAAQQGGVDATVSFSGAAAP